MCEDDIIASIDSLLRMLMERSLKYLDFLLNGENGTEVLIFVSPFEILLLDKLVSLLAILEDL